MSKRALWYIASPRKLKAFYGWADKVDYVDKLIVKNHMHHDAQEIAMSFFFSKGYDYFIISSDDVLGKPHYLKLLIEDENEHGFPVISGWRHRKGRTNVTIDPVKNITNPKKISENPLPWIRSKPYPWIRSEDIIKGKYGHPFFKAWFVGLPLTLIRRDILKKIPLKPFLLRRDGYCITSETKKRGRGKMFDLQFAINCAREKIPITIDARIEMDDIKGGKFHVGDNPRVEFIKAVRAR